MIYGGGDQEFTFYKDLKFSHVLQSLRITKLENAVGLREIRDGRNELVDFRDFRRPLINQYDKQRMTENGKKKT